MASGKEKGLMGVKKKKGKRVKRDGNKEPSRPLSGKECWDFGKQLGLSATMGDEDVEKFFEGLDKSSSRLGEEGEGSQ